MSTKLVLLALLTLAIITAIRLMTVQTPIDSDKFKLSGQITSSPYLSRDQLVFYLGRYKINTAYQNLEYGMNVEVLGSKNGYEVKASQVKLLKRSTFEQALFDFRKKLDETITAHFPSPQSELLSGILLGIKTNLPREFKQDLISTGTIHVVVVSGYNIILIGSFVLLLAPFFGRKKTTILALGVILIYTLLVGFSAPTLRALLMGSLGLIAVLLGKRALAVYSLILTGLIMLLINPDYLFDISFQLSFAATLGVLTFTRFFETKLMRFPRIFRDSLATSLSAQILVLPLIYYYFGQVSLMAPLVNTLVLWSVPVSTILGFIFLFASFISSSLADIVSYLLIFPLTIFTSIVEFFGQFSLLVLNLEKGNLVSIIGYYLVVLSFGLKFLGSKINTSLLKNDHE